MSEETKLKICPEDKLAVLLPAWQIPDKSTVHKRTGEQHLILRHELRLYQPQVKGTERLEPVVVRGCFLLNERGDINQIEAETKLCWVTTAEDLVDTLKSGWNEERDEQ